jgi:polysaccharide pyruvyl transferase WcaK-like protein
MKSYHCYPFKYVGGVPNVHKLDTAGLLQAVGGNVGNLAFQYPMQLLFDELILPWNLNTESTGKNLIVTAANWIEEKDSAPFNEKLVEEVFKYDDVLIYGLGAQAKVGVSAPEYSKTIPSSVVERVKAVAKKVHSIGVRDLFTQEVLNGIGVENVIAIGCSSIFMNNDPKLGQLVSGKCESLLVQQNEKLRVTLNEFTHNAKSRALTRRDLNANIRFLKSRFCHYLLQGRHSISCYFGESDKVDSLISDYLEEVDTEFFYDVLRNRSVLFTDIPNWLSYYKSRDLVVGTRIHGAILALQAGTPTVLITHDSRTIGLSKVLCIPAITAEEFSQTEYTNKELLQICKDQLEGFDENRLELASKWKNLIVNNGFEMSGHIERIIGTS